MTIDEAIKGSQEASAYLGIHHQDRLAKSVRLGIEALKRELQHRKYPEYYGNLLLSGETEE